jgi:Na+/H+ antiporter NhaC
MALLVCLGWLPDFGPMRRAEKRVRETGEVLRPGAVPLAAGADAVAPEPGGEPVIRPALLLELALPVGVVVGVAVTTLLRDGSVMIVEAFLAGVTVLVGVGILRGRLRSAADIATPLVAGAQSVVPALLIVAMAYALNAVAGQLGVGDAIVAWFGAGLEGRWLVTLTFVVTAALAFATGTSWGAFAMMMPIALPVAFDASGGAVTPLVSQTVAAIAGGGIFGDHASPVSDTTVLASVGAGSDHMDHVVTQLPYALVTALITAAIYLI